MKGHSIHRLDEFLSNLASLQPDLLTSLPQHEQPSGEMDLDSWVLSLSQRRLVEIAETWILHSLDRLNQAFPSAQNLFSFCFLFQGEFDVQDALALYEGEFAVSSHPFLEETARSLEEAARLGLLITLRREERYCIPFPVRLACEGTDPTRFDEHDSLRLRYVHYMGKRAAQFLELGEELTPSHWRYSNMLAAHINATDLMVELMGFEANGWEEHFDELTEAPDEVATSLVCLGRILGPTLGKRMSPTTLRLFASSLAASRGLGVLEDEQVFIDWMGQYLFRCKRYELAVKCYDRAIVLHQMRGEHDEVVVALSARALAFRELKDFESAIDTFQAACSYARVALLPEAEIDTANCVLPLLLKQQRFEDAATLANRVLRSLRRYDKECPSMAELLVYYGEAYRCGGQLTEGKKWLLLAYQMGKDLGHRPAEAAACLELSRVYYDQGNSKKSYQWALEAVDCYLEISDYTGYARSVYQQFCAMDDEERAQHGASLLKTVRKAARKSNDYSTLARVFHHEAEKFLRKGDLYRAVHQFQNKLEALRHVDAPYRLVQVHFLLYRLYLDDDSIYSASAEALRAQAITRSACLKESAQLAEIMEQVVKMLTEDQFEALVYQVTEELEAGELT